jgi:hypothetical protein
MPRRKLMVVNDGRVTAWWFVWYWPVEL